MNLLLPLRDFSPSNNLELKYMLRGVEMYLPDTNIYIITKQLPKWITNVQHIIAVDRFNKEYNLAHKLLAGMMILEGNEFLYMGDDHFLLEPLIEFPYYFKGSIQEEIIKRRKDDSFRITMENTLKHLLDNNRATNNFDMHCPIVFDKNSFISLMTMINWNKPNGFGIRSLYCNMHHIKGEYYPDLKIDKPISTLEIAEKIHDRKFFSTTDGAVNASLKLVLERLYPSPSKYEK